MRIRTQLRDWKPRKVIPEGKETQIHRDKRKYSRSKQRRDLDSLLRDEIPKEDV